MSPANRHRWYGFHIVHHGDRDRLLRDLVHPCTAALVREGLVRRFFWIRYDLGGPHVRLRLEAQPAAAARVAARVHDDARAHFDRSPTPLPLAPERIRERNRGIVGSDPAASAADDVVLPVDTVVEAPVRFEVERYGGPQVLDHTRMLFTVSSIAAMDHLAACATGRADIRLSHAIRLLARQGWGHARDGGEFVRMLGYAAGRGGERWKPYADAADAAFSRQGEALRYVLRTELDSLAGGGAPHDLARAASGLTAALGAVHADDACAIGESHMHMTANRLGLTNQEEVYAGRLLVLASRAVADAEPGWWQDVWSARRSRSATSGRELRDVASRALSGFAAHPTSPLTQSAAA